MRIDPGALVELFKRLAESVAFPNATRIAGIREHDEMSQHDRVREFSRILPGFAFGRFHAGILPSSPAESIA